MAAKPNRVGDDRFPGDIERPGTFLSMEAAEKKVAAYLGLGHTSLLRQLLLTWPVIKAFLDFDQVAEGERRARAFVLVRKQEAEIYQASRFEKWPLGDQVNKTNEIDHVHFHIASILLHMEADINAYIAEDETVSVARSEAALGQLGQYTGLSVPARCTGCPNPALGPLRTESRLESLNRCWALLRVIKIKISRQQWKNMLGSEEAVLKGEEVTVSDAPRWMQDLNSTSPIIVSRLSTTSPSLSSLLSPPSPPPPPPPAPTAITAVENQFASLRVTRSNMTSPPNVLPLEAAKILQATMALPVSAPAAPAPAASASVPSTSKPTVPRIVTIETLWDVGRVFDGKEELNYLLKYCEKSNIWVPEVKQTLHLDPMKIQSMADFNNKIGRMYSCLALGLEIHRSLLSWKNAAGELRVSRLRNGWEPMKAVLMDPGNTDFSFRLILRCIGTAGGLISMYLQAHDKDPQGNDRTHSHEGSQ